MKELTLFLIKNKETDYQKFKRESDTNNKIKDNGHVPLVYLAYDEYKFQIYISCFLAIFSVGICIIEHEVLIKHGNNNHSGLRLALLIIHLFTSL